MSIRTARSSKRLIAAAVAVAVTASTFAISNTASADTNAPEGERLAGADRYETAAAVAKEVGGCDVVLVNGNSFADGLSAAGIAATNSAVVLLTEATTLPAVTLKAIEDLADSAACSNGEVDGITIVGGTSVVSEGIRLALLDHVSVSAVARIGGADRYATSLAVAEAMGTPTTSAIIVTGRNFPDALAAGPLAFQNGVPILLHDGATPSEEILAYLVAKSVTDVTIIGGINAVPQSIEDALEDALGITVTRLAGADRFATAVAVADELDYDTGVILANGRNFPDALAAAPLADDKQAPILLVDAGSIPAATAAWHVANADTLENVWAVGGTSVVSATVLNGAVAAAKAVQPNVTAATATFTSTQAVFVVSGSASGEVTLSAVAGSAADGTVANGWSVKSAVDATATTAFAVGINSTTKTITVTVKEDLAAVTAAQFVAGWNASDAAALFTAAAKTAGAIGLSASDTHVPLTLGETVTTLTLSLNRKVRVTAGSDADDIAGVVKVWTRNGPNGTEITTPALDTTATTGTRLSADGLTLTVVFQTSSDPAAIPTLGTAEVRIAAQALEALDGTNATGVNNVLEIARRLTAS